MKSFFPVLVFQKVGNPPAGSSLKSQWITSKKLENWLQFLIQKGYHFVTPADLRKPLPNKPIMLAFIGAFQSFYTEVLPLLKKYKIPATCAVAIETLGTYNSWQNPYEEPWQNILTPQQLNELVKSKLVQVATLGLTGNDLTQVPLQQARQEIAESIHRLKKLHNIDACAVALWPWARPNKEADYNTDLPIFTAKHGVNDLTEKKTFRVLEPNWLTRIKLSLNK